MIHLSTEVVITCNFCISVLLLCKKLDSNTFSKKVPLNPNLLVIRGCLCVTFARYPRVMCYVRSTGDSVLAIAFYAR